MYFPILLALLLVFIAYWFFKKRLRPDETIVAKVKDMRNGEMKEVRVGSEALLLVKDNDTFHALGKACTHYGASLAKGAYSNGKVRCPWHGACFDIKTGDIEDFPGCLGIPTYPVRISGENVIVKASAQALRNKKASLTPYHKAEGDNRKFVILGAGAAGTSAAFQLRKEGFKGKILLIGNEPHLAYDRPKLSKALNSDLKDITLFPADEYKKQDIETLLGKQIVSLVPGTKTVHLSDGTSITYDAF